MRKRFLVVVAVLLIAVMPLTAYADDQGIAPEGVVPAVDNSTPTDSEPEEGNEEEEDVVEQPEEPETDEGEPAQTPAEEDPDKEPSEVITGDTPDTPEKPEAEPEEPENSPGKIDIARQRLAKGSSGDEIYLGDLGLTMADLDEILAGTLPMEDFSVFENSDGFIDAIYFGDMSMFMPDEESEEEESANEAEETSEEAGQPQNEEDKIFETSESAPLTATGESYEEAEEEEEIAPAAPAVPVKDPLERDHAANDIPELMLTLSVGLAGLIKAISSII